MKDGVALLFDDGAEGGKPPSAERRADIETPKPIAPELLEDLRTNTVMAYGAAGAALAALSAALVTRARKRLLVAAATLGVAALGAYLWR